jgi:hypothetical protein
MRSDLISVKGTGSPQIFTDPPILVESRPSLMQDLRPIELAKRGPAELAMIVAPMGT